MSAQPVVLPSDIMVLPATTVGTAVTLATRIRNTDSIGVLLDKIVFLGTANRAAAAFSVRLSYQGIPITNGWLPAQAFCWPQSEIGEANVFGPTVRLAKPIYLGPGEWIDVSFNSAPNIATLTASAAGHGYQAASKPPEQWLPYFTGFLGALRNIDTDANTFSEVSTPQDLGNPFDNDLQIERLIGRALSRESVGANLIVSTPTGVPGNFFVLTLSDDRDNLWIAARTPIQNAFNASDRSWRMNTILPPKAYLRATIEGVYVGQNAAPSNFYMPLLGLVGYRRIYG